MLSRIRSRSTSNGAFPPVAWVASLTCSTFQMAPDSNCAGPCLLGPSSTSSTSIRPEERPTASHSHSTAVTILSESLQWEPIDLFAKGAWAMVPWGASKLRSLPTRPPGSREWMEATALLFFFFFLSFFLSRPSKWRQLAGALPGPLMIGSCVKLPLPQLESRFPQPDVDNVQGRARFTSLQKRDKLESS